MVDFLTAVGLMFVLEGCCYALFPEAMTAMMARLTQLPTGALRIAGLFAAGFGFVIIAVLRGH